ncbi:MAG: DUF1549 domain-containing protein [Planctomycetota bacterium]|nr:DUF1549 domain-containing protein [Planctomycetota bacterium]MDA1177746.1 DUF1549 domain-containing protein [Planctomycetota bacterium]
MRRLLIVALMFGLPLGLPTVVPAETISTDASLSVVIDRYIEESLARQGIQPVPRATDATLVRRLTLDLVGRIPTRQEARAFVDSPDPRKRELLVDRLTQLPGYVRHNAREFDRLLSGENQSAPSVEAYLQIAISTRKPWDRIVADLLGVADEVNDDAARFVVGRLSDRDALTRDVSSVLFGVNVSCCQCHDHPSVDYLSQDFYFGMKAFFHRSYEFQGRLMERAFAEPLQFEPMNGEKKVARLLLVSGKAIDFSESETDGLATRVEEEDKAIAKLRSEFAEKKLYPELPGVVPRKLLLDSVLQPEERHWLAKSIVNRLWYRFMGHGLVMRVDQMHPENPASHPELLDWLANDFVEHEYDLHRLVRGLILTDAYSRSSVWTDRGTPEPNQYAAAQTRPLTPMQYALSLYVASRADLLDQQITADQLDQRLIEWESEAKAKIAPLISFPTDGLQIGANEALRLSNDSELVKLLGEGLTSTLTRAASGGEQLDRLFWTALSRPAEPDEVQAVQVYLAEVNAGLTPSLRQRGAHVDKVAVAEQVAATNEEPSKDWLSDDERAFFERYRNRLHQVVWSLLTSAEFRFNH